MLHQFKFTDDISLLAVTTMNGESATATVANRFMVLDAANKIVIDFSPADINKQLTSTNAMNLENIDMLFVEMSNPMMLNPGNYKIVIDPMATAFASSEAVPIPEPPSLLLLGLRTQNLGQGCIPAKRKIRRTTSTGKS
jgi:hypothetical protein